MLFTATLVVLFLLKLRFPRNTPISQVLRQRYGHASLRVFRNYEQASTKLVKKKLDLKYLISCKSYNVFPKFLSFKLYRKTLCNSNLYKSWQRKLLNNEIETKRKKIINYETHVSQCSESLRNLMSHLDFYCLCGFVRRKVEKTKTNVSKIHEKKLQKIGANYNLKSCDPNKVIFNHSNVVLSIREKFLLSFGLDFCLPIYKPSFFKYFLAFENVVDRIKNCKLANGYSFERVIDCIRSVSYREFYGFKPYNVFSPIFTRADISILKNLGKNKDVVICRPDKGRGVVLLNRKDYINKMKDILNDFTKFTKLRYTDIFALTTKLEDKVNRFIKKLLSLSVITLDESKSLKPTGSNPAKLYGLPKTHKSTVPLRPIMAAYDTACYKLAKFLVPLLSNLTINEYTIKNSYKLTESLSDFQVLDNYYMCSYDVKSLFTNVPLDETIDICTNLIFEGINNFKGMTKAVFKDLLSLVTKDGLFIFNNELYKQIEGVAMGSPLGPTVANNCRVGVGYHHPSPVYSSVPAVRYMVLQSRHLSIYLIPYESGK